MAKRTQNRYEKRAEYDAFERRQSDEEEVGEDEKEDEEEDEDEEASGEGEAEGSDDAEAGDEEEAPKPKKAKKKPAKEPAKKPKPRTRTPKIVRMKVVWGVFNNSNVRVAVYEYPRRQEAQDHAERLTNDKKSTHFVQPVKEPIEEKKEAKEGKDE